MKGVERPNHGRCRVWFNGGTRKKIFDETYRGHLV
jgi:hypothetical protein